jgi:hypothetical protein
MERRATGPDELEDLFRIDHLTTRMRRHAEGLIILSGETPARGWRQPVPLIDVLRAAVAEVEDYTRIRVLSRTRAAVAGHAVADVIHLVAELAENATVFSPPNTPVRIHGDIVGRGLAIEIEDRGLGISAERLAEFNADLADPPQFDLSDSDRLGLFITGQLARRHDISVTLQPSVYGGTTAIVLIPTELVVDENSFVADPALEAGSHANQRAGRHAALAGAERGLLLTAGNGHAADFDPDPGLVSSLPPGDRPIVLTAQPLPQRVPSALADLPEDDLDERVTTADLAELGLPVRVRQASLAPQLRDSGPAMTPAPTPSSESPASPESAMNTMSALQRGWQLGRSEADGAIPGPAADPPPSTYGDVLPATADAAPAEAAPGDADQHSTD